MKRLSIWLLETAERFFLWAHFWEKVDGKYIPPDDYPSRNDFSRKNGYLRSHAVNSQKQYIYNPTHGGSRVDPDLRKEKGIETL